MGTSTMPSSYHFSVLQAAETGQGLGMRLKIWSILNSRTWLSTLYIIYVNPIATCCFCTVLYSRVF